MSTFRSGRLGLLAATLALAAPLPATAGQSQAGVNGASTVIVTAGRPSEQAFRVSPRTVKLGTVIFKITNLGKKPHTFGINGRVSKLLQPGARATLTVVFKKRAQYYYTDTCMVEPEVEDASGTSCAGGLLKVI